MAGTAPKTRGLRVTAVAGSRRVDLVLPGALPLADLVPEIARSLGLLDGETAHGGYRVATTMGRPLVDDLGLQMQGVSDGDVIVVGPAGHDLPVRVYDDAAEAMADAVEHEFPRWHSGVGRVVGLSTSGCLLAVGAAGLALQPQSSRGFATGLGVAAALALVAILVSRLRGDDQAAVLLAWLSSGYAACSGWILGAGSPNTLAAGLTQAGVGATLTSLVCLVALRRSRALVAPPGVMGLVLIAAGSLPEPLGLEAAHVLVVVGAGAFVVGDLFPPLALAMASTRSAVPTDPDAASVDAAQILTDARTAHEILLAISLTVGLLLVIAAPVAVGSGIGGAGLAVASACVAALRTRHHRSGRVVVVGLGQGLACLLVTAAAVLVLQPRWQGAAVLVLIGFGALILVVVLGSFDRSARRRQLADIAEFVCLVTLLPLVVVTVGVV